MLFEGVGDLRSEGRNVLDSSEIRGFLRVRAIQVSRHYPFIYFINNGYNGILVVAIIKSDLKDSVFFLFIVWRG